MRLVALLLLGLLSVATARAADPSDTEPFSVKGITVDVLASDATRAREAGFRMAQRQAWRKLWARMTDQAENTAPGLGDSTLSGMIAGVDVVSEQFSSKRYIAQLNIDFDPIPIRSYIGKLGIGPQGRKSHPILLLPVLKDGGAWSGVDPRNPWFRAWTTFGDVRSAIDYVRVTGAPSDVVFLTAERAGNQSVELMRLALLRYGAEDFAVAEARLDRHYPGGPVSGVFRIYHGLENRVIGKVELTANSPAGVPAMMAEAVQKLDDAMNEALKAGKLKASKVITAEDMSPEGSSEPEQTFAVQSFRGIDVLVETPNAQAWSVLEQQLRRAPSVSGLTLTALSLGGTSQVRLAYASSADWLNYDLDQIGLRLAPLGDGRWLLRPRRPGDAPVPRPAIVEGVGEEGVVTQAPAAPGQPAQGQAAPPATPQPPPANAPESLLPPGFGQQPRQE